MKKVIASILTIGDELLMGQTVNTNNSWLSRELNNVGIWVHRQVTVGDNWDEIWKALNNEIENADIVIITGGLGPTADDITKPLLSKYFGGNLIFHQETLHRIETLFTKLDKPLLERNRKQAEVPDSCIVLKNKQGTAPGMHFIKNEKNIFSLPGVPHEMKELVKESVIPYLQKKYILPAITFRILITMGQGESFIAELLIDFEKSLPTHISLAYLPSFTLVKLRLTGIHEDASQLEQELNAYFQQLKKIVSDFIITEDDQKPEELLGTLLVKNAKTIATAESCTGGKIAQLISSIPGASTYFKGGIVCYANETKENLLHVPKETIKQFGAVSEEVVRIMFHSTLEKMKVDFTIAVTGIMGPSGGSLEKPVGTVWMAVGSKDQHKIKKLRLPFDRTKNIATVSQLAIFVLLKLILKTK